VIPKASLVGFVQRIAESPAWRARLLREGYTIGDLEGFCDLAYEERSQLLNRLPELSRADLSVDALAWVSDDPRARHSMHWTWSSGSTGSVPLAVPRFNEDLDFRWRAMGTLSEQRGVGRASLERGAFLCALPRRVEACTWADSKRLIPIERVSLAHPDWVERLQTIDADFWNLSPVGLERALEANNAALLPRPRIIYSTALRLPLSLRLEAEQTFRSPVLDLYSTAETGPIAVACPESDENFHLLSPWIQVLTDRDGLKVTRFSDSPLPLLNYRVKDRVRAITPTCPTCPHLGSTLLGLQGRVLSEKGEHRESVQRGIPPA